ncbi:MAG: hypothetical protein H5T41_06815 [Methanomassiliicoccales archaeon]|jgi:hypothetical protein|nr:hypothetical protein [Methanomassiliicoccales archaeon]
MSGKEIEPNLTKGSKCRVISRGGEGQPLLTTGEFKGYVAFGHDTAISIELDDSHGEEAGRIRLIPCIAVLSIDLLQLKREEEKKESEEREVYFR